MTEGAVRELVLTYFQSWQTPSDWTLLRSCLADDVGFDSGQGALVGADSLLAMMQDAATPWEKVLLIGSVFHENNAALMYDGTAKETGAKFRVAEHIEVKDGEISKITAAICPLG